MPKKKLIPLFDRILDCNTGLKEGIYLKEELGHIYDSLPYPYPYYIGLVGALAENDTKSFIMGYVELSCFRLAASQKQAR